MAEPIAPDGAMRLEVARGLSDVPREAWDRIANPPGLAFDPFLSWDFLEALERSEAVHPREGWTPVHLLIRAKGSQSDASTNATGELLAAMPLYAKDHSRGEYVFDHAWADAYQRAGGHYYPKLLSAIPFTPVTGRRRLVGPGADAEPLKRALLQGAIALCTQNELSGLHVNFPDAAELDALREIGLLARLDQQFVFTNQGYRDFSDFLGQLSSDKRKNLRKERIRAQAGLDIQALTGSQIEAWHWDVFFNFYQDTGNRKYGSPYLNRQSFALFHERLREHILLILAFRGAEPIAGALNFIGSDALFGRYWGAKEFVPGLHFELCYYQAIDFACARGLSRVEAGAQGEHKLARGYAPHRVFSAHWISNPQFRRAIGDYLAREQELVASDMAQLQKFTPFRQAEGD